MATVLVATGLLFHAAPDRGKFVLALRRARGGGPWLIAADLDQSNWQPQ